MSEAGGALTVSPGMRLEPADEYTHQVEAVENFNESMYFNVYDPVAGVGGWFRIGNRPNEGYAEMTCCIYRPDGSVGFIYGRPEIAGNDAFDAGGMRFEVVEPFEALTVAYSGSVLDLPDPLVMRNPRDAFGSSSFVPCEVRLDYRGVSPMLGGESEDGGEHEQGMGSQFARAHYEQHMSATGSISLGGETWQINGFGLRDHSWGPRYWQALAWYRWLTCNAGPDDGFMVAIVTGHDGSVTRSGVLLENGEYTPLTDARLDTDYSDAGDHVALRCTAATSDSRELEIRGRVISLIPLRNRRAGLTTTIGEGLTEYTWTRSDGEAITGFGMAEYLDQREEAAPQD